MKDQDQAARVFFLSNNSRFDIASAERYGERVFLFSREPSPFNTDSFKREVLQELDNEYFDAEIDHVALTGGSVQVALFLGFIMQRYHDKEISVLLFDARTAEYNIRTLQAGDKETGELIA